jgi:hypothetical protein
MDQLDIHHEDVLMKMFMYSLEGDARGWYRSLPPSSISSLQEFHTMFHHHFKIFYPDDLLFENCCKEFEFYIQHSFSNSSGYKDEAEKTIEHVEEESSPCKTFSSSLVLKEESIDCFNDKDVGDSNIVDTFVLDPNVSSSFEAAPNFHEDQVVSFKYSDAKELMYTSTYDSYENDACHEEIVAEEDFPRVFQEVSYDVFSPVIEEKDDKQVPELVCVQSLPVYDKFENILTPVKDHEDKLHFHPSPEIFDNNGNILQQSFVFQNMRDHNVIHIADSVQWQPCPLDQPKFFVMSFMIQ